MSNSRFPFWLTLNVKYSGKSIPIHPLDITTVTTNGDQTICTNAYR